MNKTVLTILLSAAISVLCIVPNSFSATYTIYNNVTDFTAAVTPGSLLSQDFNGYSDMQWLGGVGILAGVNITSNMPKITTWSAVDNFLFAYDNNDTNIRQAVGTAYYQINYASPYNAAGFDVKQWETDPPTINGSIGDGRVQVYFADGTSASVSLSQPSTSMAPVFFGIVAHDTTLSYVQWYEPFETSGGNEETALDNVVVGNAAAVPIPPAILLLGSGLAGLATARSRFKK